VTLVGTALSFQAVRDDDHAAVGLGGDAAQEFHHLGAVLAVERRGWLVAKIRGLFGHEQRREGQAADEHDVLGAVAEEHFESEIEHGIVFGFVGWFSLNEPERP